jgi:hypothetical protein
MGIYIRIHCPYHICQLLQGGVDGWVVVERSDCQRNSITSGETLNHLPSHPFIKGLVDKLLNVTRRSGLVLISLFVVSKN